MIVFIAGVHGVGKTFIGQPVAEKMNIKHVTASSLIREELQKEDWRVDKLTSNIDLNQEALISAVSKLPNDEAVLLDGHFVLRNASKFIEKIPADVFKRLNIEAVILLEAPADVIQKRLLERGDSQRIEDIIELAENESEHAKSVCSELNIPLHIVESPSIKKLMSLVESLTIES